MKKIIPTLSWQTPTLSLRVLCGCSVHGNRNERVGIIFLRGMWGSVWGSSRILQVPYVIPRPGVPRHIIDPAGFRAPVHQPRPVVGKYFFDVFELKLLQKYLNLSGVFIIQIIYILPSPPFYKIIFSPNYTENFLFSLLFNLFYPYYSRFYLIYFSPDQPATHFCQ